MEKITKEEFKRRQGSLLAAYNLVKKAGGIGVTIEEKFFIDNVSDGVISQYSRYYGSYEYRLYGRDEQIVKDEITTFGLKKHKITAAILRDKTTPHIIYTESFEAIIL